MGRSSVRARRTVMPSLATSANEPSMLATDAASPESTASAGLLERHVVDHVQRRIEQIDDALMCCSMRRS